MAVSDEAFEKLAFELAHAERRLEQINDVVLEHGAEVRALARMLRDLTDRVSRLENSFGALRDHGVAEKNFGGAAMGDDGDVVP